MTGRERELGRLLDVEQLDRDLFRGRNGDHGVPRPTLYGGQVAAQALVAAGRTVDRDRVPHSLHGYFLRPGGPERPVLLHVDRDRDGGSFSARHVRAVQDGEVILSMLASFHAEQPSGELVEMTPRDVSPPDEHPYGGWDQLLEVREVTQTRFDDLSFSDCMWVRAAAPLPDDPLVQRAALLYASDLGNGFGQVRVARLSRGGPSIDHALWFHAPVRADEWLLLDLRPTKALAARGLYRGTLSDAAGRLGAVLQQEVLLRWGGDTGRGGPGSSPRT